MLIKMKCESIYVGIIILNAFFINDAISIYSPNDGIKTKSFRRDPRISDPSDTENQSVVMHHQYSQVVSNHPHSQYISHYNQNKPNDATTSTTAQTTSHHNYQGSSRVYQESDSTNNRLGRTSSKIYEIENNITPYQTECPPGATGQFPYSLDCRRFLNCWKGRGYIQTCAPGTVFNPETLECDSPQKVSCHGFGKYEQNEDGRFERLQERPSLPRTVITASSNPDDLVKCHPSTSGVEPHPFDCTKFLNCAHGLTHIQSCGPGTVFNELISACDHPDKVDCGKRALNVDVRKVTINEHYQQNTDGKFGRLQETVSVPRTIITSTSTQDQNALVKCHPSTSGIEPHPFDCTKFLNCAHGLTHIQSCGPGTVFNELIGVCDYPDKVDCGTRRLDVTSTTNHHYEARRPYNEHVISSPTTQTIHKITTSYSNYPTSYGSSSLQKQGQDHLQYIDHQHTQNCNHHSHSQYSQQNSQNSGQKTNVVYTQSPGTVQVVYPAKWNWNSSYNPSQSGRWSYTRNITTVNSQSSGNNKPDVTAVYPSTDDDNVQRPTSLSQFTGVNPEQEEENGQRPLKPNWNELEAEPLSKENEGQRPVNPNWTSGGSGSHSTTSTFYAQSQTRQPGYGSPQPSSPIYTRQPPQSSGPNQGSWSTTTTTRYVPSYVSSSTYNRKTPYGSGGYPSYQQRYNQSWTSTTTTTQQQNRPQTPYGNVYIQQATVKEIPKSNFDLFLEQYAGMQKNISVNNTNTSPKVYYANSNEENFDNIAGGDIPAYTISSNQKNTTKLHQTYESDEETGQKTLPFDYQNPYDKADIISSQTVRHESVSKVEPNNDNLFGGLLPPYSSSEVSTPSKNLLPPHTERENFKINDKVERTDDNFYGELVSPHSSSEIQSSIPIPSAQLLPPYTDEERKYNRKSNISIVKSETVYTSTNRRLDDETNFDDDVVSIPSSYMKPPLTSEEERQKNLATVSVPPDHMLPPFNSEEDHQKSLPSIEAPSEYMLPPFNSEEDRQESLPSVSVLPDYMLPPFNSEEDRQKSLPSVSVPPNYMLPPFNSEEDRQKSLPTVSVPPDYMLPPLTPEEKRQKDRSSIPVLSNQMLHSFTTEETKQEISSSMSRKKYEKGTTAIPIPSDHMLPPMTSEEERQKVLNSTSIFTSVILPPSGQMLPPMTPEEEIQKAFNSTSKVIPLGIVNGKPFYLPLSQESKSTDGNTQRTTYTQIYNPSYSSVTHSKNWSQTVDNSHSENFNTFPRQPTYIRTIVTTTSTNHHPSSKEEYYPPPQSLNSELEAEQVFNDSVIVQSPPIRIMPVSPSSLYRTTTRPPPSYSGYNRQYYKGSTSSSSTNLHSDSEDAEVSNLPISDAMKLLLRPYLNRSGTVTKEDLQNSETHIMKVVKTSYEEKHEKQEPQQQHEKDVEFIFTGEQPHLNQEGSRTGSYNNDDQTNYHNHHHHHHHHHHPGHNEEFHRQNTHLPNPFESPNDNIELGHHHDHHFGHNKEFHKNNPHLPDPFGPSSTNENRPIRKGYTQFPRPTPLPDTATIPSPDIRDKIDVRSTVAARYPDRRQVTLPKITTTTTVAPNTDTICEFDCTNGKCVREFEVCDGVNNCGNRLDEKYCDHLGYEVRLSNEEGKKNMGRVEVKIFNKWGYVCDDKFGMRDADVLCRELGFPLGAVEVQGNSYYPPHADMVDKNNDVLFVMDEIDCIGNETSLKECDFKGWGVHDCTAEEVVGVVCKIPVMKCPHDYWLCSTSKECIPPAFVCDNTPDCADKSDEAENICNSTIQYRLADGDGRLEGRVEVKYRGKWGTICDDDFTDTEAQVVCKSLGFYGKAQIVKNAFGAGTGPIWLDQVSCFGSETSLDKCIHWEWGEHNCNHSEDVSIRCSIGSVQPTIDNNNNKNGIKGRSSSAVPRQGLEPINSEEFDNYMYQMERSSKMLNSQKDGKKCGHFNTNIKDEFGFPEEKMQRVVQGTKAHRGRHPWQATIRTKGRGGKSTHWCGAVLISKRHLLTAAHCLTGYEKGAYFVRLGDHYANIAESSETDIFIENWYIHEEFRKGSHMNNDIALIVLKSPVQFNDYIQPICLPSKDASYEDGKMCTISGWGSIQSGLSTPSNYLRAAQVPIIGDSVCKRPVVYGKTITDGMFCAGYLDEGTDACDGDSGGPLVCTDNGFETLYGIISWGQHCGYANKPGVYVKISHYIDWIHNKINFLIQSKRNNN